jgi:prolipoprotein diacylglyceryltransferase
VESRGLVPLPDRPRSSPSASDRIWARSCWWPWPGRLHPYTTKDSARLSGTYATTHPTQLYSSLTALVIFVIMWRARLKPRFTGQVALILLILYPVARFVIEFYRADPRGMWRFGDLVTLSEP